MTATEAAPTGRPEVRAIERRRTRLLVIVLAVLSVQFVAFGVWEAWRDAPTNDEFDYVAAGVTAWTQHDLRLNNEHPPLPKLVAALPVLLARPHVPTGNAWDTGDRRYAQRFFAANRDDVHTIVFLSRLVPILEGLLVGLGCFALGSMLFGRAAGIVGAAIWLTTPVPLAFSHLDGLDVPAALFAVGSCLALAVFLRRPSWSTASVVGIAAGLGLLTRWTAIAIVPVLALVVFVGRLRRDNWRERALQAGSVLLIAWVVLWAGYRVVAPQSAPVVNGAFRQFGMDDQHPSGLAPSIVRAVPLPKEYVAGFEVQQLLAESQDSSAFILGDYRDGFTWWFWPATVLVKVPYLVLGLVVLAPFGWRKLGRARIRDALLVLILPLVAFSVGTYTQAPEWVGVRYLLPVFALAAVAIGPVVRLVDMRRPALVVVGAIVVAQLLFFWSAVPRSLSWTNPGFGPGYRSVADSSFEIGQELDLLRAWSRGRDASVWGGYGFLDLPANAKLIDVVDPGPLEGDIAISASALTEYLHDQLSWLRAYCPVDVLGDTILVYRIRGEPDLRPGPDAPREPCPGKFSRRID